MFENASYMQDGSVHAFRDGVETWIPASEDNPDWLALQAWVSEGNEIASYSAPAAVTPSSVTIRQAKLQMSRAGILGAVNDFIDGMEGQEGEEARIEWDYATELRRDHPLVAALGPQFNLTDADIDDLFVEAAKIA